MRIAVFEEMKSYIGFTEEDAIQLRELKTCLERHFSAVVNQFYEVLLKHPEAAAVFRHPGQVERLREQLKTWLATLFSGRYDEAYWNQRAEIGRAHVRIGLAQHYMFAAMEVIRQELQKHVVESGVSAPHRRLESLHKLLCLEIGMMLETYKESYSEQIREGERAVLRERLVQAEHLAQIGQLAASLAHEIKNPLAGISGAVQVLRGKTSPEDGDYPVLGEILRQIERLDGTVEDLLVYARPKPPNLRPCRPEDVVRRALDILEPQSRMRGVSLIHEAGVDCGGIEADADQLEQVLINVLLNAIHASSGRSTVRVRTRRTARGVEWIVEDRGQGMSEAVRRRVFEPFFTTKVRGTGLGLAICRQIISAHGGTIDIESTVGEGTTVTVRLPRHPEETHHGNLHADSRTHRRG